MTRDTVGIPGYTEPSWLAAVRAAADQQHLTEAFQETWTLGKLTAALNSAPIEAPVEFRGAGLDGLEPDRFISWRGVYADLAIEPVEQGAEPVRVRDFLARCLDADGETFTGYKGGDYTMDADTPVWVDHYGDYHHWGITAVRPLVRDGEVVRVLIVVRDHDAEATL